MQSIKELLQADRQGKRLTKQEREYLKKYKNAKNYRHSTSFIYHSRRLRSEDSNQNN